MLPPRAVARALQALAPAEVVAPSQFLVEKYSLEGTQNSSPTHGGLTAAEGWFFGGCRILHCPLSADHLSKFTHSANLDGS